MRTLNMEVEKWLNNRPLDDDFESFFQAVIDELDTDWYNANMDWLDSDEVYKTVSRAAYESELTPTETAYKLQTLKK